MKSLAVFLIALSLCAPVMAADKPSLDSCCATNELLPPIRLEAGGEPIDTGKCIGHSGPLLIDVDQDGALDLLVGDLSGHLHFFKNGGAEKSAAYAAGRLLEADGEPIKIKNW